MPIYLYIISNSIPKIFLQLLLKSCYTHSMHLDMALTSSCCTYLSKPDIFRCLTFFDHVLWMKLCQSHIIPYVYPR